MRGGPGFVLRRLWRRPSLLAAGALAAAVVGALSSRIWEVRVEGSPPQQAAAVRQALAELGLRPGMARSGVQTGWLERELLLRRPELAWAEVRLVGSVAVVQVRPRLPTPDDEQGSGDVVASHDGMVTELVVAQGWPAVRPGEVVRRGQVLISGRLGDRAVRAAGWVRARVWAEGYGESGLRLTVLEPAGEQARGVGLQLGPWRLELGAVRPPWPQFRRAAGGGWRPGGPMGRLPVQVDWVRYERLRKREVPVEPELARRLAEERALEEALSRLGPRPEILRVERTTWQEAFDSRGVVVRSRVQVEAIQEIGRFQPHGP